MPRGLPKVAQTLVTTGIEVAGLATIRTLRILSKVTGNVGFDGYLFVKDANNVTRAEMGNLPANGNSPAQFGLRADDASGTPIFDSLGLLSGGVGKLLGSAVNFSQSSVTGNGSWQAVSGSTVNFTPTRPVNILVLGAATILDPTVGDTGFNLEGQILFDSASNTSVAPIYSPGTASFTTTLFAVATGVSAAAHSFSLGVNQTNTHLWSVVGGYVFVFQFGN